MNWHILVAILVAGTAAIFTDWLFTGILFHDRYNKYPEVWWPGIREGKDRSGIVWASILGYLSTAAIVVLCTLAGVNGVGRALALATLAWIAGPMLVLVVNGFFIKLDPRTTVAHCAGYLVRFLISGLAAGIALG
jgi:amino acid transporter